MKESKISVKLENIIFWIIAIIFTIIILYLFITGGAFK